MAYLLVIPSIDLKKGKCVRVVQGIPEVDTYEYSDDPVEMAKIWRAENAKCLHIVDFDGAWYHSEENMRIVREICSSVIIPVQFAGGIRNIYDAERAFDSGIYRLCIGTMVMENFPEFIKIYEKYGPKHVAISIDVLDNYVLIKGRRVKTDITLEDLLEKVKDIGVERFCLTDVTVNGMLAGPSVKQARLVAETTGKKVTLSGGVKTKDDLFLVQNNMDCGIDSVIVGRALYENRFPCQKIWRLAEFGIFD